jgi:uncharacterized protein
MAVEVLDAALDFLARAARGETRTSLRLGSGEPLLALPLLRRAEAQLAASRTAHGPRTDVFLTTNGTLLDDRTADWLASAGWNVKISLDGPRHIHDAWRVSPSGRGTFRRVAAAVVRVAKRMPDRLSVTAVLCRGADPEEVFEAVASMGVRRIELVPVAHRDPSVQPDAGDVACYGAFVRRYARRIERGERPPTLVRFAGRVARVMGHDNQRIPCAAGRSLLGVGPDGALYPCFRFVGLEAHRLGSLDAGLAAPAAASFRAGPGRPYEARDRCRSCWAAPLCGGPCFACAVTFGAESGRALDLQCAYALADARAAAEMVGRLRVRAPRRLLAFLPRGFAEP